LVPTTDISKPIYTPSFFHYLNGSALYDLQFHITFFGVLMRDIPVTIPIKSKEISALGPVLEQSGLVGNFDFKLFHLLEKGSKGLT